MHGTITDPSDLLVLLHNAVVRMSLLRMDTRATALDVADEAANIRRLISQVSYRARELMPQTVFKGAFWRQLVDFSDSEGVTAALGRIATAHGTSVPLIRGEFFEAVITACQMVQTIQLPPRRLLDIFRVQDQRYVVVAVRGEGVARIIYRYSSGRIVVSEIVAAPI